MIAAIILTPLIFGFFLIFGAYLLDPEEHPILRVFMMLLSLMTYFVSSWFGMLAIVQYYDFSPMQEAIATAVWVFGIMIFVIVAYFMIYAFYKGTHAAAQRKKEMMLQ